MKKIIAVATMAAMVAGAAFAAEASASVEWVEELANYDGSNFTAFNLKSNTNDTVLKFAFSGEQAGAEFTVDMGTRTKNVTATTTANGTVYTTTTTVTTEPAFTINLDDMSLWVKPIDALKINVGSVSVGFNGASLTGWEQLGGFGRKGLKATFTASPITVAALIGGSDYGTPAVNANGVDGIGASASVDLEGLGSVGVLGGLKVVSGNADVVGGLTFKSTSLVENLTLWADARLAITANEFDNVAGDVYASYAAGDLTASAYGRVTYTQAGSKVAILTDAKVSYALGDLTAYVGVKEADWADGNVSLQFVPGVSGKIGECDWDVCVDTTIAPSAANAVTFSVPLTFTVNF